MSTVADEVPQCSCTCCSLLRRLYFIPPVELSDVHVIGWSVFPTSERYPPDWQGRACPSTRDTRCRWRAYNKAVANRFTIGLYSWRRFSSWIEQGASAYNGVFALARVTSTPVLTKNFRGVGTNASLGEGRWCAFSWSKLRSIVWASE